MRRPYALLLMFLFPLVVVRSQESGLHLPEVAAKIQSKTLVESSGLTRSQTVPDRYWSLNDSGHRAELFVLNSQGEALSKPIEVRGAKNKDWEAVTFDAHGNLWIGDFGNNENKRRNLRIYRVKEPGEELPEFLTVEHTVHFEYPDQESFPAEKLNFDCEAMFWWENQLFLLSKHRADKDTKLYAIGDLTTSDVQTAVLLDRFAGIGQVTDASLSKGGTRLAVLTFSGIWIFERSGDATDFLKAGGQHFLFKNWALRQIEGMSWMDENTLFICNEQKEIFHLSLDHPGWKEFTGRSAESGDESP